MFRGRVDNSPDIGLDVLPGAFKNPRDIDNHIEFRCPVTAGGVRFGNLGCRRRSTMWESNHGADGDRRAGQELPSQPDMRRLDTDTSRHDSPAELAASTDGVRGLCRLQNGMVQERYDGWIHAPILSGLGQDAIGSMESVAKPSINSHLGIGLPFGEELAAFVGEDVRNQLDRALPKPEQVGCRDMEFIKAGFGGVCDRRAVIDGFDAGPMEGGGAHGAWLGSRCHHGSIQENPTDGMTCRPNCLDFRMGRDIGRC